MKNLSYFAKLGQLRIQSKFTKILSANYLFSIPLLITMIIIHLFIKNSIFSYTIDIILIFLFIMFVSYYNKNYFLTLCSSNKNAILLNNYKNMKENIKDKKAEVGIFINQLENLMIFIPIIGWIYYYSHCFYPYMILDDTFYLKADSSTTKKLSSNYKSKLFLLDLKLNFIAFVFLFIIFSLFFILNIPITFLVFGYIPFMILRDSIQTVIFYDSTFKNTSIIVKE